MSPQEYSTSDLDMLVSAPTSRLFHGQQKPPEKTNAPQDALLDPKDLKAQDSKKNKQPWQMPSSENSLDPIQEAYANEAYLFDNASILDRKSELRQLLKLIHLSRQGQSKAVLLSADAGMGKTALIDTFVDMVHQSVYSRVVDCRSVRFKTPQHFYVTILTHLQRDAQKILQEALLAINEELFELGMSWEQQDLLRAVSLAQLQETVSPKSSNLSQEQLAKAIKNSVPTIKKLRLSIHEQVDKLVKLVLNPWVIVASQLINPIDARLQEAFALSELIVANKQLYDPEFTRQWENKKTVYFQSALNTPTTPPHYVNDTERSLQESVTAARLLKSGNNKKTAYQSTPDLQGPMGSMANGIRAVLSFINRSIASVDTSLLLVLDHWENVAALPSTQRDELKTLMKEMVSSCVDTASFHMMLLLSCDTQEQGKSLGGALYGQFRTKLLLSPLDERHAEKLLSKLIHQSGIDVDEPVVFEIYRLSQGNPYWHSKIAAYLIERAKANRVSHIDPDFYYRLCIEQTRDVLELAFTRVTLAFLQEEDMLYKAIAALLSTFSQSAFKAAEAIREISLSQRLDEPFVYNVLNRLVQHHFLIVQPFPTAKPAALKSQGACAFDEQWLMIQNWHDFQFLQQKTRSVQADISTDEKLQYLKKVIPLSVHSGELDRGKTQEVLSLCDSLGNTEMVGFLESLFIDSLKVDKPVVRVTALNNLALIDSEKSRQALFVSMTDQDAMVREYAARNLATLSQKNTDPDFHRQLVDLLLENVDDDYEAVRAQVYQALGKYRWTHDLMSVFIKGLSDADASVRLCSVKFLAEYDQSSPFIKNSLLDAIDDPEPEVRKYACIGIQRYDGMDVIETLVERLRSDDDPAIRSLAADSLSMMEDDASFEALSKALMLNDDESQSSFAPGQSEDVKLAIVRALGKRRGWQCEQILLNAVQSSDQVMPPALLWACIRSIGQVAASDRAINALVDLGRRSQSDVIQSVAQMAIRKIRSRMEDLRTMEQQLEAATPLVQAVPTEYAQEVVIREDEPWEV